ncbi:MAG: hypothetical protein E7678_05420 [Ruminococcaceae bacterium]|nr:hypothetical protein [Oscillospiraceae bacterium]
MKKSIKLWQLLGFITTSLGGTLLHFLFEWLNESIWIAPFSGINESTWEHMKLFFWPTFIFAITQSFFFKERKDFWCVKLRGILFGIILIPILFYTYNGIIGKSPSWINIAIFFISSAIAYIYETRLFKSGKIICKSPNKAIIILCLIAATFILFTFRTPEINIFKDPLTGSYGI